MEILEGMPYLLASPSDQHQRIVLAFGAAFLSALRGKPCQPRIAPLDVFLDEADERKPTVVQPDVFVVCDRKKLDDRGCHGAPDLIIEVLSPGTRQHDLVRKMNLYRRYGVREYWTSRRSWAPFCSTSWTTRATAWPAPMRRATKSRYRS